MANRSKELFLTPFTIILKRANFLQLTNPVLNEMIHVKCILLLMPIQIPKHVDETL